MKNQFPIKQLTFANSEYVATESIVSVYYDTSMIEVLSVNEHNEIIAITREKMDVHLMKDSIQELMRLDVSNWEESYQSNYLVGKEAWALILHIGDAEKKIIGSGLYPIQWNAFIKLIVGLVKGVLH